MMALNPPGAGDDGSSSPPPSSWPMLLLDSGASYHMVGDPRLLSDLRDAPAGSRVSVLDGTTLPMTKIGDIQMTTAGFTIPGVFLVPGLKMNVISVRQLTRQSRICTWFDDSGKATLYAGSELVGVALAQENFSGLYVLQFLRTQLDRLKWSQFPPLRVNTRKPLRLHIVHMQKQLQLRLRIHMQKQGLLPVHGGDDGSSSQRPLRPPKLLLDSGASSHTVSDPRLLSNLRDAPAGLSVVAANGNTMPVTKIGDIHIQGFTVQDVQLVPGLEDDGLISVHQLAKDSRICTWFDGDWATLYAGAKIVGHAVAPRVDLNGLYILRTPKIAAA